MNTNEANSPQVRIGTSSFSEEDWVGPFYPRGAKPADFLTHYATHFNTVEIDATYYAIPSERTVDGWARKTPDNFLIAAKFPRSITHGGDSHRPDPNTILLPDKTYADRDRFLNVMSRLGDKLGPLLIQFPYFSRKAFVSPEPFMERLDRFLSDLPGADDFRFAVEIRNRNWLTKGFAQILRNHNAALTLVDHSWMPHGDKVEEMFDIATTDFVYIRLLGDRKKIEEITTSWEKEVIDHSESLERWAGLIGRISERNINTLAYINNHYAGHAPATAQKLRGLLSS
ncbi:MAG: DUF72 domain-containing protein [candidate division Zixibacteria bacterium]|nr:DUF72 domain-containing protein [candidate division Zixibacteria bacterium]